MKSAVADFRQTEVRDAKLREREEQDDIRAKEAYERYKAEKAAKSKSAEANSGTGGPGRPPNTFDERKVTLLRFLRDKANTQYDKLDTLNDECKGYAEDVDKLPSTLDPVTLKDARGAQNYARS